jgi:hypothetical protein
VIWLQADSPILSPAFVCAINSPDRLLHFANLDSIVQVFRFVTNQKLILL